MLDPFQRRLFRATITHSTCSRYNNWWRCCFPLHPISRELCGMTYNTLCDMSISLRDMHWLAAWQRVNCESNNRCHLKLSSQNSFALSDIHKFYMTWSIGWKLQAIHKFTHTNQFLDLWKSRTTTTPGLAPPNRDVSANDKFFQNINLATVKIFRSALRHLSIEVVD